MPSPTASPGRHPLAAPRTAPLAAFYFLWLGALGLFWPYFGLYLRSLGFGEAAATRVLAVAPAMGLVAPPLLGLLGDARRIRPWLLRGATAAAAVAFLGFFFVEDVAGGRFATVGVIAVVALFSLARAPVSALADAAATEQVGEEYGRVRLWGSLGFLVAVLAGGAYLDRAGVLAVLPPTAGSLALAALLAWRVPAPRRARADRVLTSFRRMVGSGSFWQFLAAITLTQVASASYDAGFSLHLARQGHSRGFIGLAWAIGVVAEVAVLAGSGALLRRRRPARLFAFSILVAAARWAALSSLTGWWMVLLLQPLHGITFGLWYASAVQIAQARAGEARASAQGLLAAASALGSTVGMALAGALLASGGGRALYGAGSAVALGGAAFAAWYARSSAAVDAAALPARARAVG